MARAGQRAWSAVVVDTRRPLDEELAATLAADCLGADEGPATDGGSSLRIFIDDDDSVDARLTLVDAALRRAGLPTDEWTVRVERVEDGRWVERYMAGLRPFPLGRRFVIDPAGNGAGEPGDERERIRLVPGRAFGTGEHPTTRLCAVGLERFVQPGSRWLDVGCGTGILSLVASRCGASEVLGVDLDADALAVARDVLRANAAPGTVRLEVGGIDDAGVGWDGVVVNIETGFVDAHAGALAAAVVPGGLVLVSGVLAAERFRAERRLQAAGLAWRGAAQDDGWALIVATGLSER